MPGDEKDDGLERVRRYNLDEHRDELRRVLVKILRRRDLTGRVEIDLSQGSPGAMRSREVVKGIE